MAGESFRKRRDALETYGSVEICPDCDSSLQLRQLSALVFVLEVAHDATCPWMQQNGGHHA